MSRSTRGFALSDVLLGLVLLSLLFIGVATLFPITLSSQRKSERIVVASDMARQTLEDWRDRSFQTLVATTAPQVSATPVGAAIYTVTVTVSDPSPPDPNVKIIDVQVTSAAPDEGDVGRVDDTTCVFNYANPW